MTLQPVLKGSLILVYPKSVTVNASSSATITTNQFLYGTALLYVNVNLPSGVTASVSLNSVEFPLVNGSNNIYVPGISSINSITFTNSNTSASTVSLEALVVEV